MADNPYLSPAAKLRAMLKDGKIVVAPGVYDGITARLALSAGFDALYMTGAGTTISKIGYPDLGVATQTEMAENASMIAGLDRNVPVIADADTGYGGPLSVARTVQKYISGGVAALHLEDQVVNKRCGHLSNKSLVPVSEYTSRIRAAVAARSAYPGGDIIIIARTDALASLGYSEALARLKAARDAGADVAFLEGVRSHEEAKKACEELAPMPCLLNMVNGGQTPNFTVKEAKEVGYKMVIYPGFALAPVFEAVSRAARELRETGDIAPLTSNDAKTDIRSLFEAMGLKECVEFDIKAGGDLYANGV